MHLRRTLAVAFIVGNILFAIGCASSTQPVEEAPAAQAQADAPLGSRIKRKSAVNPVATSDHRNDLEAGKSIQNAAHSRAYQK